MMHPLEQGCDFANIVAVVRSQTCLCHNAHCVHVLVIVDDHIIENELEH